MRCTESSLFVLLKFFCILLLYSVSLSTCDNVTEEISPAEQPGPKFGREVVELAVPVNVKPNDINDYREIVLQPYSNTRIHLVNYTRIAGETVGYALVQLHAFEYNVTLSYNSTLVDGGHLSGQNVGLLMYGDGDLYALNLNPLQPVWVSLVLMLYNTSAPIPGGCNLEFPVEISPILNLTLTPEVIIIDTPAASVARPFQGSPNACGKARLLYESYYYTMPMHDFSQRSYFSAIRALISYANAKASGRQNTFHAPLLPNRHKYGRIDGQGMVFVTAVIDPVHRGYALYVPTHTYSCKPFINQAECYGLNIPLRTLAVLLTIIAVLEVVMGWLPLVVKAPVMLACASVLGTVEVLNCLDKPLTAEWIIIILAAGALVGLLFGLLMAWFVPIAARILCTFLTGYLICLTLFGLVTGNFYNLPNVSWFVALGSALIGGILSVTIPVILITRSVIFGAVFIFYSINAVFGARLDYPLRHFVRRLYVENYERVYSDPALDENDFAALATFGIVMVVALFLRSRYQPDEVPGDYTRIVIPCHGRPTNGDDEDRIERSTVIAADDTAAYQRFVNEQPVITRWTNGDDDVFESPESNSRFYRLLRRNARR
uniref:TM7S3/TM198-like domain-containing protein n=1 Tax=Anopheles dirus TaxID=7168 RepID=A0A1Y9H2S6_9DIPT